jgi:hypothetical protein
MFIAAYLYEAEFPSSTSNSLCHTPNAEAVTKIQLAFM